MHQKDELGMSHPNKNIIVIVLHDNIRLNITCT